MDKHYIQDFWRYFSENYPEAYHWAHYIRLSKGTASDELIAEVISIALNYDSPYGLSDEELADEYLGKHYNFNIDELVDMFENNPSWSLWKAIEKQLAGMGQNSDFSPKLSHFLAEAFLGSIKCPKKPKKSNDLNACMAVWMLEYFFGIKPNQNRTGTGFNNSKSGCLLVAGEDSYESLRQKYRRDKDYFSPPPSNLIPDYDSLKQMQHQLPVRKSIVFGKSIK